MVLLIVLAGAPGAGSAADPAGRVDQAEGKATGMLDGSVRDLEANADVFLQELVQTSAEARLALALGADTRVLLGERTRLKIEKSIVEKGGTVLLESGAMLFDRPDSAGPDGFVVRTPFAIIAARGTEFFVGPDVRPDKAGIEVFVERGMVTVRNNAGRVELTAGEGTAVPSPDLPPSEPAAWGASRIAAAYARVGEER
jgi:ferric-dicitrate binding protein FerR (iron transport regulator)